MDHGNHPPAPGCLIFLAVPLDGQELLLFIQSDAFEFMIFYLFSSVLVTTAVGHLWTGRASPHLVVAHTRQILRRSFGVSVEAPGSVGARGEEGTTQL